MCHTQEPNPAASPSFSVPSLALLSTHKQDLLLFLMQLHFPSSEQSRVTHSDRYQIKVERNQLSGCWHLLQWEQQADRISQELNRDNVMSSIFHTQQEDMSSFPKSPHALFITSVVPVPGPPSGTHHPLQAPECPYASIFHCLPCLHHVFFFPIASDTRTHLSTSGCLFP